MNNWIYKHHASSNTRYVLGEWGINNLICIGINPSTATPENLDPTIRRVKKFAQDNGYDGWFMLNVYPQIETNPKLIDEHINNSLHEENIKEIKQLISEFPTSYIWAAWGNNIQRKPYLFQCLKDVVATINADFQKRWVHLNDLTTKKHPKHPLYLPNNANFKEFDIHEYLKLHA
ncbi:MAG TPA: DUF1643 domain-containing protein [Taishania sp.]|nr:DUF1643 domain-containing protein [Taishania sp.]